MWTVLSKFVSNSSLVIINIFIYVEDIYFSLKNYDLPFPHFWTIPKFRVFCPPKFRNSWKCLFTLFSPSKLLIYGTAFLWRINIFHSILLLIKLKIFTIKPQKIMIKTNFILILANYNTEPTIFIFYSYPYVLIKSRTWYSLVSYCLIQYNKIIKISYYSLKMLNIFK